MKEMEFSDFYKVRTASVLNPDPRTKLTGVSIDSRSIQPGNVFWAIRGDRFDGHDFVEKASQSGAAVVVIDRKYKKRFKNLNVPVVFVNNTLAALQQFSTIYRRKFPVIMLGITGSNGKTTTKEMVTHVLGQKFIVHKTEGNLNNLIGVPLTLFNLNRTHQFSVVEMGTNQSGEIEQLAKIARPTSALITNIGHSHIQYLKSRKKIAAEKKQLFNYVKSTGIIFQNLDDPYLEFKSRGICTYSLDPQKKAMVQGQLSDIDENGCGQLLLNNETKIKLKIPGVHQVQNALAACAVAITHGISENEIRDALEAFTAVDKRMQILDLSGLKILNDSYNANPESFSGAIETLLKIGGSGKKYIVAGDMLELGKDSVQYHREILEKITDTGFEGLFLFGPHFESAAKLLHKSRDLYDSHEAIANALRKKASKGDIILIKGSRGMQMEKVLDYLK